MDPFRIRAVYTVLFEDCQDVCFSIITYRRRRRSCLMYYVTSRVTPTYVEREAGAASGTSGSTKGARERARLTGATCLARSCANPCLTESIAPLNNQGDPQLSLFDRVFDYHAFMSFSSPLAFHVLPASSSYFSLRLSSNCFPGNFE